MCVYLFGNPIVYWLVLLTVIGGVLVIDKKMWMSFVEHVSTTEATKSKLFAVGLCLFGWIANYVPYPLFVKRTCFVYHYHPSLYFGILVSISFRIGLLLKQISNLICKKQTNKYKTKQQKNSLMNIFLTFHFIANLQLLGCLLDYATQYLGPRLRSPVRVSITIVLLLVALAAYVYYMPFSYAIPITDQEHEARRILHFFPQLRKVFPIW
jgi:dolichyl-phosphate-mannose--protein O-mannosyl transferase